MTQIEVKTHRPYSVFIGESAVRHITVPERADKLLIVSDSNTYKLFYDKVSGAFANKKIYSFVMGAGEKYKTIATVTGITEFLSRNDFTREDMIVALGGGVVGDTAGFAAAIYMRGIDFIQIPTTLLAAIDSSVGGKTGVNQGGVKNVIGAFHQPTGVYIDTDIIGNISEELFLDGLGEGVKYAALTGGRLRDIVMAHQVRERLEEFIALSVRCKAEIVAADEKEGGLRRILNLGHTIGHAIETISGNRISHGVAVAVGISKIESVARELGLIAEEEMKEVLALTEEYFSGIDFHAEADRTIDIIRKDKKAHSDKVSIVYAKGIGNIKISDIGFDALKEALHDKEN